MSFAEWEIFCSVIIPTVGRSSLARTVESVLQQEFPGGDFEILVMNDSGTSLPAADWQTSTRVRIIDTNRRERSVARNTGAAIAKGKYLHFLDDDDWLAPGAFQHLWTLSCSTDAKWLYGITELVDRENKPLIQLRHGLQGNCFAQVMAGEWIPLQSSWIERKTFLQIGGFNPLLTGPEDIDLLRRILLEEEISETANLVSHVTMGGNGSTTDYAHHPQASRRAREHILDEAKSWRRMRVSADGPFWKGRVLRIYLTSIVWNLQQRRLLTAASRAAASLVSMAVAGRDIFSGKFWQAVSQPYASITFERGIQDARGAS
jgi:glycosyltransferase involved in cell wall biosynthesis